MLITKIRKIVIKYHIGTFMVMMFMFVSCTKDKTIADLSKPQVNQNINSAARSAYSDIDVFKGVVFLEGPVAQLLEEFQDYNFRAFVSDSNQIQNVLLFQQEIINYLTSKDSQYFQKFRTNIGSNDFDIVKSTFIQAGNDI